MRFKVLGVALLVVGAALVGYAISIVHSLADRAIAAIVYCLTAIFLALAVRLLQAERHHRAGNSSRRQVSYHDTREEVNTMLGHD